MAWMLIKIIQEFLFPCSCAPAQLAAAPLTTLNQTPSVVFMPPPPLLEPACTRTRPGYWKPRYLLSCKRESAVAQQRRAGARLKNILGQTCAPAALGVCD